MNILIDKENDKNLFWLYLFNEKYLSNWGFVKKAFLGIFKELGENLSKTNSEEEKQDILNKFIDNLYQKHEKDLILLKEYIESLFSGKTEKIFEGLKNTMDYNFENNQYNLYFSFLTVSTFNKNSANISILNDIGKNQFTTLYIDIFIHEISHIIFNDKINKLYKEKGKLDLITHNYFKEIFAPIIIRDKCFDNIRQGENYKYANTQQQLLNIELNGKIVNIVDYFEYNYKDGKKKGLNFDTIIDKSYDIFLKIQNQIIEKNILFFKLHNGENLNSQEFKEKLINSGFGNPIIII